MNRSIRTLVCVLGALSAAPSSAAVVTAKTTLDLARTNFQLGFTAIWGTRAFTPFSVTVAEGDTFDFTIGFRGHQPLTLYDPQLIWALSFGNRSSDVVTTGALSLLDAAGNAFLTSATKTDTERADALGQYFYAPAFGGLPSTLTFYGLRYVGTVDDYVDPAVTRLVYNAPVLVFDAARSTPGYTGQQANPQVSLAVPEPASWALFVAGFGLVGTAVRRRRTPAAAA